MDSGSYQFNGHFCESLIVLLINQELATFHSLVDKPLQLVVHDVEYKLDELKASRSPVEAEIKFVEEWLSKWNAGEATFTAALNDNEAVDNVQEGEEETHSGPFMVK